MDDSYAPMTREENDMQIKYENLSIRNARKEDCPLLEKWWNDGAVMAHAGFPNGLGTSAAKIEKQIANDSDTTQRRLIIEYDAHPIGEMSFYNRGERTAEIGIKICEFRYQEKGLGRCILSLFLKELFSMGFQKIILDTDLENTRAQHVYELLGFRKVTIHKDSWVNQIGEPRSSVDYELTETEFKPVYSLRR